MVKPLTACGSLTFHTDGRPQEKKEKFRNEISPLCCCRLPWLKVAQEKKSFQHLTDLFKAHAEVCFSSKV
jgi:hypothetical protein